MKLKMAENSLFAILLRSPWWVSLLLAAALSLIAWRLLPERFVLAGMFGAGAPFLVIATIAAWRQLRAPSPARQAAALDRLRAMTTTELLDAAQAAWQQQGFEVRRCKEPGADLVLQRAGRVTLVSLRRWRAAQVGLEPLRALHAEMKRHDDAAGWYAAGGEVGDRAREFAREQGIRLLGAGELALQLAADGQRRAG